MPSVGWATGLAGAWGFLPFAVPALAVLTVRLGALCLPRGTRAERLVGGATIVVAFVSVLVRALAFVGLLATGPVLVALTIALAVSLVAPPRPRVRFRLAGLVTAKTAPLVFLCTCAFVTCVAAARLLPIWQWDSLGYHLPFVSLVLQARSYEGLPPDLYYTSTYPHVVEATFVFLRVLLPDDRLIDLGQCGLGLLGAAATAAIARSFRASVPLAVAAGAAWLVVPAVFLQLPTNYVDVGAASFLLSASYFLLLAPTPRRLLVAATALGLYLGSKPSAPVGTAILLAVLAQRAFGARWVVAEERKRAAIVVCGALAIVAVLGVEAYAVNVVRHGNPIWPAEVRLGPIHLGGPKSMQALLSSGANAPQIHGSFFVRVLRSWASFDALPAFDMRFGGMGPLFVLSLPFAFVAFVRKPSAVLVACIVASLASPDPALARYVLAFPALVLALAAATVERVSSGGKTFAGATSAALALWQLGYAIPGLTGEGPPLARYWSMTDDERLVAVGADGPPSSYAEARDRVGRGESLVYDENLDLAYLAWDSAARFPSYYAREDMTTADVARWLSATNAKVVIAGKGKPLGDFVAAKMAGMPTNDEGSADSSFELLFECKSAPCAVYERREVPRSEARSVSK